MKLRKALRFLKTNHLAYDDTKISEENFCSIEKETNLIMETSAKTLTMHESESCFASEAVRNARQNQFVEDSIATSALTARL